MIAPLRLEGVSKRFARSNAANRKRLIKNVLRSFHRHTAQPIGLGADEFWAIQDLDLTVARGETVGVIGFNGAGKTTLLHLAAGHLRPDSGLLETHGRVEKIINLTGGFESSLTGRENLYLAAALRGRTKSDFQHDIDEIIDFAGLGSHIDAAFRGYSQGMRLRLAFALSIHCKPDVFIIDEILAVGDFKFQQKCLNRLQKFKSDTAIVFASHNLSQVENFCDRVVVLDSGTAHHFDDPRAAVQCYITSQNDRGFQDDIDPVVGVQFSDESIIDQVDFKWHDKSDSEIGAFPAYQPIHAALTLSTKRPIQDLAASVLIYDNEGTAITTLSSRMDGLKVKSGKNERIELQLTACEPNINAGEYAAVVSIVEGMEVLFRESVASLNILPPKSGSWGILRTSTKWTSKTID